MGRTFFRFSFLTALCAVVPWSESRACDCQTAHAITMGVPSYGGISAGYPLLGTIAMGLAEEGMSFGGAGGGPELPVTPMPPGTVGQTYSRISHPVPSDEHPRTAMLAVRDNQASVHLSVQNMGGIRMKSGIWLFESKRPLDPGACQIVRVEARNDPKDIEPVSTRFVRLIPGRIVYLDF